MFKAIKQSIRRRYLKRLFLHIYFSYLDHPNQSSLHSALPDAVSDFNNIVKSLKNLDNY